MSLTVGSLPDVRLLNHLREFFAAGYFEKTDASPMQRWSRAVRRRFEHRTLTPYNGEFLYPCGPATVGDENRILAPSYSFTYAYNESALVNQFTHVTEGERGAICLKSCGTLRWIQ